jgi:hypothetical protein
LDDAAPADKLKPLIKMDTQLFSKFLLDRGGPYFHVHAISLSNFHKCMVLLNFNRHHVSKPSICRDHRKIEHIPPHEP